MEANEEEPLHSLEYFVSAGNFEKTYRGNETYEISLDYMNKKIIKSEEVESTQTFK